MSKKSSKASKTDWRDATLALALAAGGGLLVLLSVLTLENGGLPTSDKPLAALARTMIGNFGLIPSLLAGLTMAGAGTYMFLSERYEGVVKHMLGVLCTVAGLAVLLGALSADGGGRFGAAIGGTASSVLTKGGGVVIGLIVLLAPVWLFWFRDRIDFASLLKSPPRSSADSDAEDAGVSALEAEALAPVISAGTAAPDLANPYPEDVRLKGALPAGTLPLDAHGQVLFADAPDDTDLELADSPYIASVNRWTPARDDATYEPADEDLVAAELGDDDEDFEDELGEVRPLEPLGDAADPFAEHSFEREVRALDEPDEDEIDELDDAEAADELNGIGAVKLTSAAYQPPRPSWEVDEEEAELARAVPLEVSEALAGLDDEDLEEEELDEVHAADDFDEDEDEDEAEYEDDEEELEETLAEDDSEDDEEEEEFEDEEELEETLAADDSDDDEEDEDEFEEEADAEDELEETFAEDDSDEDEDEDEAEFEDEEELEETLAEGDSEDEEDDEEEFEDEEELEETLAEDDSEEADDEEYEEEEELEDELEETYAEDDSEEDEDEDEAEYEDELEETLAADSLDPHSDAHSILEHARTAVPGEVQMDLFDEPVATAPEAAAAEPIAAADSGESEPEVVLAPQAAGEGSRKISAQLLTDAGNLFVSEQRVAVSMLQKRFALDFGQSCVILDELQELGLIGPYVDGAPRDILMSSEDWLELTGQS